MTPPPTAPSRKIRQVLTAPKEWTRTVAPQAKIVTAMMIVACGVALPPRSVYAYAAMMCLALLCALAAGCTARGMRVVATLEFPFLIFALMVPFVARGPRVTALGVSVSIDGLWSAWSLVAKAIIGGLLALALASSTSRHDMVVGFQRLRLPSTLLLTMSFMVRYIDVIADQWRRMTIARASRGFRATSVRQWWTLARSLGALFVSCYERGERVHMAMLARGYTGVMPTLATSRERPHAWPLAIGPAVAVTIVVLAKVAA